MNLSIFDHMPVESGTDIDKLLILADWTLINRRRNAGVISIAVMRILKHSRFDLRFMETRYRALDSFTFLIGMPSVRSPPQFKVMLLDNTLAPYYLWICVNGRNEANDMLTQLGFTYEQNLDHLDKTGFMTQESR